MKKIFVVLVGINLIFLLIASLPCYAGAKDKKSGSQALEITADDGAIYACYKTKNGQLRLVDSPDDCRPSEESISWGGQDSQGGGGIDLGNTYVTTCDGSTDCACSDGGRALTGYAVCPPNSALAALGTPILDAADYTFHASCVSLADGTNVTPVSISVRCIPVAAETNCSDGLDDDADGFIDCADTDCAADPVCQVVITETNCSDGVDDDADGFIDCADTDCAADPVCSAASSGDSTKKPKKPKK